MSKETWAPKHGMIYPDQEINGPDRHYQCCRIEVGWHMLVSVAFEFDSSRE
ncbi:hypothetical protein ACLOJK_004637 [Asimina triloba]